MAQGKGGGGVKGGREGGGFGFRGKISRVGWKNITTVISGVGWKHTSTVSFMDLKTTGSVVRGGEYIPPGIQGYLAHKKTLTP
jgi:hypothetical protein